MAPCPGATQACVALSHFLGWLLPLPPRSQGSPSPGPAQAPLASFTDLLHTRQGQASFPGSPFLTRLQPPQPSSPRPPRQNTHLV